MSLPTLALSQRAAFELPDGLLYLDCAAHGPRLKCVQQALLSAVRAAVPPSPVSAEFDTPAVERLRGLCARLYGDSAEAIAFVPSAAFGLSVAAANLPLARGEAVLVLDGQFPSNLLCWQQRARAVGAHLQSVRNDGDWTASVLAALEDPCVRIAALPQVYWRDGSVLDLDAIADAAHARGIALVLDLSQSLGARAADVARWRPQFAVSVGHKWALGAFGLATLWAAPHWRDHGQPLDSSWTTRTEREHWTFDAAHVAAFRPGARRFDAGGVLDRARIAASTAALEQLHAWDPAQVSHALQARVATLLAHVAGDAHYTAPAQPAHFVGLRPVHRDAATLQRALAAEGIVCTARHGVLRLAPHLNVDDADLRQVASVLHRVARCG